MSSPIPRYRLGAGVVALVLAACGSHSTRRPVDDADVDCDVERDVEPPDTGVDADRNGDRDADIVIPECLSRTYRAVWGSASDDVYVAGDCGRMVHFDGAEWSRVELGTIEVIHDIWGTSPDDIVLGAGPNPELESIFSLHGTLLLYDGVEWSVILEVPLESGYGSLLGTGEYGFQAVWGVEGAVLAAGGSVVLRSDGTGWTTELDANPANFRALCGTAEGDLYATGRPFYQLDAYGDMSIWRFDGESWTDEGFFGANDLWCSPDLRVFGASGCYIDESGNAFFIAEHRLGFPGVCPVVNGEEWNPWSIWGVSSSEIYVVGEGGNILSCDGVEGTLMPSPTELSLYAVWGTSADDIYAVGAEETILHYDGSTWEIVAVDDDG